jgi:hypothetical protein
MKPGVYVPASQPIDGGGLADTLVVRTKKEPMSFVEPVRRVIASVDPEGITHGVGCEREQSNVDGRAARRCAHRRRPVDRMLGSWAATRVLKNLLYGVSSTDPTTFALVASVKAAISLAACWLPARRASRLDPIVVLREE